ncbi:hypothetical protein GCM10022243_20020 [Saccharothrix violaceirubra]
MTRYRFDGEKETEKRRRRVHPVVDLCDVGRNIPPDCMFTVLIGADDRQGVGVPIHGNGLARKPVTFSGNTAYAERDAVDQGKQGSGQRSRHNRHHE